MNMSVLNNPLRKSCRNNYPCQKTNEEPYAQRQTFTHRHVNGFVVRACVCARLRAFVRDWFCMCELVCANEIRCFSRRAQTAARAAQAATPQQRRTQNITSNARLANSHKRGPSAPHAHMPSGCKSTCPCTSTPHVAFPTGARRW